MSVAIKPWYFFFPDSEQHAAAVHAECGTGLGNGGVSGRRLKLVLFKIKPSVNQGGFTKSVTVATEPKLLPLLILEFLLFLG